MKLSGILNPVRFTWLGGSSPGGERVAVSQRSASLFADPENPPLLVHCCYHKAGTHWMKGILNRLCERHDMTLERIQHSDLFGEGYKSIRPELLEHDVLLDGHSRIDLSELPRFRGSHMIRDPRDMTVSGYFYHLWAREKWLHVAKPKFGNRTYQQQLNSLNREDGLIQEVERFAGSFRQMADWNYNHPDMFELRYETLLIDDGTLYRQLFSHYGFNEAGIRAGLRIAEKSRFEARAKRNVGKVQEGSVMRSGKPGQWQEHFTPRVRDRFKELAGDVLVRLGYESDHNW